MKRLFVLLLVAVLGVALYRRLSGSRDATPSPRPHRHGTPDHWPPVVRKPGSKPTPTASSAPAA